MGGMMSNEWIQRVGVGRKRAGLTLLTTGILAVLVLAATTRAEAAAAATSAENDQTGTEIGELVVTAEKRSERFLDVPTSISVVTSQDIKDKDLIALSDIANRAPNVVMSGSSIYPNITIRGVGSPSGTNPGFAPAATVYVDDVYQGRERAANLPLTGIDQIEVLRGPQGTLYGKDTIAGAINITTQKPTNDFEGYIDAQSGNLEFTQLTGTVSGPVVPD